MLSYQFSLQSRKQKKNRTELSQYCKGLGGYLVVAKQEIVNDEGRVVGIIVIVESACVFDFSPHAHDPAFQSLERL